MTAEDVVSFWLGLDEKTIFVADPAFDKLLAEKFGEDLKTAGSGGHDGWADSARGALGLVILLDQLSRNIYRGSAQMFANDDKALSLAKRAIASGYDAQLPMAERFWFYMPFMHAEDLDEQTACVAYLSVPGYEKSLPHAIEHRDIIARFGRFPHRNALLGRTSSRDEQAFLTAGGFSG